MNRVFKDKPGGLVVDYLGLAQELKEARAVYTESGGTGETAIDQEEAVAVMLEKYEICCDFFDGFDWSKWATGTPAQKLTLLPAGQEHILAAATKEPKPEEHKQKFLQAVSDLSKGFALAVPHAKAIEIRDDVGVGMSNDEFRVSNCAGARRSRRFTVRWINTRGFSFRTPLVSVSEAD